MSDRNYEEWTADDWTQLGMNIMHDANHPAARDKLRDDLPDLSVRLLKKVYAEQVEVMHRAYRAYKELEEATNAIKSEISRVVGEEALHV